MLRSEEGLDDVDDVVVGVEDRQGAPFVKGEAGVADVECQHVADADIIARLDLKVGVLIHQLGDGPVRRNGAGSARRAGAVVQRGDG